ncbi:HlyIII-domain-containing protein [Mycena sanguinolenta]|uniref:HlyIII-domain-containing protein n=1 Tax=Mycena sanguinolenta TaxID=230812 RepID=A0A8H6YNF6_9AGAR|nr:HlyIII-domain-containing protein [Mycena sanguinolenta]
MATQSSRRARRRRLAPATASRQRASYFAHALASVATLRLTLLSCFRSFLCRLSLYHTTLFSKLPSLSSFVLPVDQEDLHVSEALKHSCDGSQLITHEDLPEAWHNNPYISSGYRFIPLHRFTTLLQSMFTPHNELLNIQTHLIPMLLWGLTFRAADPAEAVFTASVLICLGSSVVWHTMSGCAHRGMMEFCARIDYVGIGWLISASVGTIVYYGYGAHPHLAYSFLALCLLMAVTGSIIPFLAWFDRYEYRKYRLLYFFLLVLCAVVPIGGLAVLYGLHSMASFVAPILPTLFFCDLGVVFYTFHLPERFLTPGGKWARRLESIGGGSHAIWHTCVVLAISNWRAALGVMRAGVVVSAAA